MNSYNNKIIVTVPSNICATPEQKVKKKKTVSLKLSFIHKNETTLVVDLKH